MPRASSIEGPKTKHLCTLCQKSFSTSSHLNRHALVHTGERKHTCPFPGCKTRCSRPDNLQQHYRVHLIPGSRKSRRGAVDSPKKEPLDSAPDTPPALVPATLPISMRSPSPPALTQAYQLSPLPSPVCQPYTPSQVHQAEYPPYNYAQYNSFSYQQTPYHLQHGLYRLSVNRSPYTSADTSPASTSSHSLLDIADANQYQLQYPIDQQQ